MTSIPRAASSSDDQLDLDDVVGQAGLVEHDDLTVPPADGALHRVDATPGLPPCNAHARYRDDGDRGRRRRTPHHHGGPDATSRATGRCASGHAQCVRVIVAGLSMPAAPPSTVLAANATVERSVDGDTIAVRVHGRDEHVRLIGIDTPETVDRRRSR